jgi:probable phosphoglycerate mutase
MEIARAAMGLDPSAYALDDRLKEIHYGHWQGTFAADLPEVDAAGVQARALDTFRWRPRGGESYQDLMARAVAWLGEVDRDTVVSAHGGISRVLRGHLYGVDPADIPQLPVPQDRILILRREGMEWL